MIKFLAIECAASFLAFLLLLHVAATYGGIEPNTILISGIALSTFGTAILTVWQQHILNKVRRTGEATHKLSNSAMGQQLKDKVAFAKQVAVLSHQLANFTKEQTARSAAMAADVVVASAELEYRNHLIQQAKADAAD